ncbi:phospholipase D family protein [Yoonia sp. 2307UL14-13]|uniref:phospholipase D family protein n=1 Tax=Yoonia sp. 2307UL14-13 TaxID=3126506 RepID=UPI0030B71416
MNAGTTDHQRDDEKHFEVLLTAEEAYPALEKLFLDARESILAGFRIFDPATKLRSDKARRIGHTWSDLITHTLDRGVKIHINLSDFDPTVRPSLHAYTGQCVQDWHKAAAGSSAAENLKVFRLWHPARVGMLPRLFLWPRLIGEINDQLGRLQQMSSAQRDAFLDHAPGFRRLIRKHDDRWVARKFPPPPLAPVSHHQKLAVFDDRLLYIGGLDVNERRYDTLDHDRPAEQTWHDTQLIMDGPIVTEAATHLREFQAITAGGTPSKTRHLLRTISQRRRFAMPFLSPKPCLTELADAHYDRIEKAEKLIYLETQFLRDTDLAKALAKRGRDHPKLTLIVVLPAAPEDIAFENEPGSDAAYGEHLQVACLKTLRDAFGPRALFCAPAQMRSATDDSRASHYRAPLIYLHAKVSIFDDHSAIVSSGNLNGRSMSWDTEAGLALDDNWQVETLRNRCFRNWLGNDVDQAPYGLTTACDAWSRIATRNAQLMPEQRPNSILPYALETAAQDARILPGVPKEMV